ncbi:MAG: four helix bundle protein [Patescibacteria group bacterium]
MATKGHKDLIVWQKSMDLVVMVYELTKQYPKDELYQLTSQMRRAAVSIPSNIAEGRKRGGETEFRQFLRIAFGSAAELETQIEISQRLGYASEPSLLRINATLDEIMRMLSHMTS